MFYIEKENKIVLFDENKEKLMDTLAFMPQYKDLEIKETDRPIVDFEFADTKEFKIKQEKAERKRLDALSLTAADVERAIYKAKGIDFDDILELVKDNPEIDLKALKIELKANNFYRGNPYINQIGAILGFTRKMLDEFFETNDYTKLLVVIPAEGDTPEAVEGDTETVSPGMIENNSAGEASNISSNEAAAEEEPKIATATVKKAAKIKRTVKDTEIV